MNLLTQKGKKLKSLFVSKTAIAAVAATIANGGQRRLPRAPPSANLQSNVNSQTQSVLFTLPAEIRSLVFTYALTDYEDTTLNAYGTETDYWYRPGYAGRRCTATELLREGRAPVRALATQMSVDRMRRYLKGRRAFAHRQDGMEIPRIHHVRVFAQPWASEFPARLQELLRLPGFEPRVVTITIKYTDFLGWWNNKLLHVDARWMNKVRSPRAVEAIKMDFWMIDRRKNEIDYIAGAAVENWFFRREDGVVFAATGQDVAITRWTGSSTWANRRWIRDESRPNEIDYYAKTVTWKPDPEVKRSGPCPDLEVPDSIAREPLPNIGKISYVVPEEVAAAKVRPDASPEQVVHALTPEIGGGWCGTGRGNSMRWPTVAENGAIIDD